MLFLCIFCLDLGSWISQVGSLQCVLLRSCRCVLIVTSIGDIILFLIAISSSSSSSPDIDLSGADRFRIKHPPWNTPLSLTLRTSWFSMIQSPFLSPIFGRIKGTGIKFVWSFKIYAEIGSPLSFQDMYPNLRGFLLLKHQKKCCRIINPDDATQQDL